MRVCDRPERQYTVRDIFLILGLEIEHVNALADDLLKRRHDGLLLLDLLVNVTLQRRP